ncbi:BRCT domain-containing protein [Massilia aerilata]|uniref:BRCT domain-containing protein n=1 Tax=Massilia aerilata TaxID=453817 RepID=A0ABW0RUW1_9BURK
MNIDYRPYYRFTGRARLEKAINSLIGLIEGIAIDGTVNEKELAYVEAWLNENRQLQYSHPFNELIPVVDAAIADGILTDDERQNILWLCEKLMSADFFDTATADMQRLHGLMGGIAADGEINETELRGLADWLYEHEHLKTRWPYEEVESVITTVLRDKTIMASSHELLLNFFAEFTAISESRSVATSHKALSTTAVCAVCPDVTFEGKVFGFTGSSAKYSRDELREIVEGLGATFTNSVSKKLDYLIIGADGNPCWAYACYGRKVEMAVALRKAGARILLVHEHDFHDAVADCT